MESPKSRLKTWVPAYGNFVNLTRKPAILTWKTSFAGWLKKRIIPLLLRVPVLTAMLRKIDTQIFYLVSISLLILMSAFR